MIDAIQNETTLESIVIESLKLPKRIRNVGPDKFKVSARAVVMSVASLPGSNTANVLATDSLLFTVTGSMASNMGRMWFVLGARIVNTVKDSLPGLLADGNCRSAPCKRVLWAFPQSLHFTSVREQFLP